MLTIFWDASGVLYTKFLIKGLTMHSNRYCATLRSLKQRIHRIRPERNIFSFASRQCKTSLQCTNTECQKKTEIPSGFTTSLQPIFDTISFLVVPKIEGNVERSMFFNGCRSSGSRAQMDTQPIRIFIHGWNEERDRTIEQICNF
ncbi:hypothetical protein TNCV_2168681 [Trichonephila clavipes]|nr:hypothetical protein TNCV_2168681 [Trichonephila clavipes]